MANIEIGFSLSLPDQINSITASLTGRGWNVVPNSIRHIGENVFFITVIGSSNDNLNTVSQQFKSQMLSDGYTIYSGVEAKFLSSSIPSNNNPLPTNNNLPASTQIPSENIFEKIGTYFGLNQTSVGAAVGGLAIIAVVFLVIKESRE